MARSWAPLAWRHEHDPNSQEGAGGAGLLLVVSTAAVIVVATEGVFIAFASWTLPLMMLCIILTAVLVIR